MSANRTPALLKITFSLLAALILGGGCSAQAGRGGGGTPSPGGTNDNSGVVTNDNVSPADDSAQVAREIEEADIVKHQDGYLYLANRYRGLVIIDVRAIERPQIVGRAAVTGRAVELYVRDERVFLVTSADYIYCAGTPVSFEDGATVQALLQPDYTGSRLTVFDTSDPADPQIVEQFPMSGFAVATRRVGDVIYVAGNTLEGAPDSGPEDDASDDNGNADGDVGTNGDADNGNENINDNASDDTAPVGPSVFVQSINIADPDHPQAVDFVQVFGDALELQASVRAVYVAGRDPTLTETTRIIYVDISDPDGAIEVRDQFRVPGYILNRFAMDEYGNVLRVVTQETVMLDPFLRRDVVALYNYDISDPDHVDRLARLAIETDEDVWAVRFDGPRGYVVTYFQIDPLFVLDLSVATQPEVAGALEVPGVSTHLVPLGDRLLAIGFDETAFFRPAVSLYNVADPARPLLLSRVVIGDLDVYGVTSEATFDEKALKVLTDEELILVPYSYLDEETLQYVDSLQIIDLEPTRLTERGKIDHRGLVRRADVLDDRLWVLSDVAFQVFDIDDRDEPFSLANEDIFSDQDLLDAGLLSCVDSARHRTNPRPAVVPIGGFGEDVANPVVYWPGLCGSVSAIPMGLMVAGWLALRFTRRRI